MPHTSHICLQRRKQFYRSVSARSEVPCWWQLLECEWKTLELWGRCSRKLSQQDTDSVLAQPSVRFQLGHLSTEFQVPNFLFSSLWQHGRGKYNVPTAIEKLWGKRLSHRSFRSNLGKCGQNILCTPKQLPAPAPIHEEKPYTTQNLHVCKTGVW